GFPGATGAPRSDSVSGGERRIWRVVPGPGQQSVPMYRSAGHIRSPAVLLSPVLFRQSAILRGARGTVITVAHKWHVGVGRLPIQTQGLCPSLTCSSSLSISQEFECDATCQKSIKCNPKVTGCVASGSQSCYGTISCTNCLGFTAGAQCLINT